MSRAVIAAVVGLCTILLGGPIDLGAGREASREPALPATLNGHHFRGLTVHGGAVAPRADQLTLLFERGLLTASGGCSFSFGRYTARSGRLGFSGKIGVTRGSCIFQSPGEKGRTLADGDAWLNALLDPPARLQRSDNGRTLTLTTGERSATFVLESLR